MNHGTTFFAPLSVAIWIKGFCAGLVPPGAGCKWQDRHWLELKRGPSPMLLPPVTVSTSANLFTPSWKNTLSSAVRLFRGPPAPGAPPRTPGSITPFTVLAEVQPLDIASAAATNTPKISRVTFRRVFMTIPPRPLEKTECGSIPRRTRKPSCALWILLRFLQPRDQVFRDLPNWGMSYISYVLSTSESILIV